jgi:acyl-[acyl carrier protein]--UDP-N-acetylglucosamine O-acyltransferase
MAAIDPTARVADGARIGDGVEIGPYCLVGPHVELKDGVRLVAHVNVAGSTTIGESTVVYPFASLGTPPQLSWRTHKASDRTAVSTPRKRDDEYRHHGRRRHDASRGAWVFHGILTRRA